MQRLHIQNSRWVIMIHLLFLFGWANGQTLNASFIPDKKSGCAPLPVNFLNNSTGAVQYSWSFGNGNTQVITNASANYSSPGTYIVSLTATATDGSTSTVTDTIIVHPNPIADFTVNSAGGCEDVFVFDFTNNSTGAVNYIWDFGDGTSSSQANPIHTYSSHGIFCVKLIAISASGCKDIKTQNNCITVFPKPDAQFSTSQSSSCDSNNIFHFTCSTPGISTWQWFFGDGDSSNLPNPSHIYGAQGNFPVSLIVTNNDGCVDTSNSQSSISIGPSLVPSFTISDSGGCAPLAVQFNSTVTGATSWSWDFGDGSTSQSASPSHVFNSAGSYDITLTVTTQSGCNGSVTIPSAIHADPTPQVQFTVQQDTGCAPFTAYFQEQCNGAVQYLWDFGNGNNSTLAAPSCTFAQGGSYPVTLTATSSHGCEASLTNAGYIRVYSPTAVFSGSPLTGCPGMTVNFSHAGVNNNLILYEWDFGDGSTGTGANVSHTYNATGIYTVSLIVTNSFGCKDTVTRTGYVSVITPQTISNPADTIYNCLGMPLVLSDPTVGSNSWNWNFGNGTTSNAQTPVVIYQNAGFYTVTLQTSMPGGCTQTFNPFAVVEVIEYNPQPITLNYDNPCKPYTVSFSNSTPNLTNLVWHFGDGDSSSLPNPVHTYLEAGVYTVTLEITVGHGCRATLSTTVVVGHSNPIQASASDVCLNDAIQFNLSNVAAFNSATWYFGDGSISGQLQPSYTYSTEGSYTVTLITTDTFGCLDTFEISPVLVNNPIPDFSSPKVACLNSPVNFQNLSLNSTSVLWDFGDGTTSSANNPTHIYTQTGSYTITLSAVLNGCTVSRQWPSAIEIVTPGSQFSMQTTGQCMPVGVIFTDLSASAISWQWNFGDGMNSALQNPSHTYYSAPTDSIRLIATDRFGCIDSFALPAFPYFAAAASVNDNQGCLPHTTQFTDLSNGAISWNWDFGDGNTSSLQHPSHTYQTNGIFTVTLIAGFPGGCFDTIVYFDMVSINNPVVDFYSNSIAGCSPTQISFFNTSTDAEQFTWYFGDGANSTNINPQNIYYIPGTYTVTLVATNSFGCTDSIVKPNYITIPGTYTRFGISSLIACQGEPVQFTDSSINASTWSWDFGDGPVNSSQNPQHVYSRAGSFNITLITWDSTGCSSAYTYPVPVIVHPKPEAAATVTDSMICRYESMEFINLSTGATGYLWNFGDGQSGNQASPTHQYTSSGVYNPSLVAINAFGCKDTFHFQSGLEVMLTPEADFSQSRAGICFGDTMQLINQSNQLSNPSLYWNYGFGTSNSLNPVITGTTPGIYSVSLQIINDNGCADTNTHPYSLEVYDTLAPAITPIAAASVLNDSEVNLIWFNGSENDIACYKIFRLDNNTQQWLLIHADSTASLSGAALTSNFIDRNLDTKNNAYSYKVLAVDKCGYSADTDSLTEHTTINVTTQVQNQQIEVSWTPYLGCNFQSYKLYRKERPSSNPVLIAVLDTAITVFTDTTLQCPFEFEYRVEAIGLGGHSFTAWSDTSADTPENPFENQHSELVRSTVYQNQSILTEWAAPIILPHRVLEYQLLRSKDGSSYQPIATLPAGMTSYTDVDVDITSSTYEYRIIVINDCSLSGPLSNRGTNILLNGKCADFKTNIYWTPYKEWDTGVNFYAIETEDGFGGWMQIGTVNGTITQAEFDY